MQAILLIATICRISPQMQASISSMTAFWPALKLGLLWLGGGAIGQSVGDSFINRGGQGVPPSPSVWPAARPRRRFVVGNGLLVCDRFPWRKWVASRQPEGDPMRKNHLHRCASRTAAISGVTSGFRCPRSVPSEKPTCTGNKKSDFLLAFLFFF
jgi:hypothetical protein